MAKEKLVQGYITDKGLGNFAQAKRAWETESGGQGHDPGTLGNPIGPLKSLDSLEFSNWVP